MVVYLFKFSALVGNSSFRCYADQAAAMTIGHARVYNTIIVYVALEESEEGLPSFLMRKDNGLIISFSYSKDDTMIL